MEYRRVQPDEVTLGEALPWPLYNAKGGLLLERGQVISSRRHLNALLTSGLYHGPEEPPRQAAEPDISIGENDCPFDIIASIPERLSEALNGLANGATEYQGRIYRLAREIQFVCKQDPDAALGAVHLFHDDRYPLVHLLHTAILAEIIAVRMGYVPERRIPLLCAALSSNLSIMGLQHTLHLQSEPLSEEQRKQIDQHPTESVEMLKRAGISGALWLRTVEQHHERIDGSGYPRKLKGRQIIPDARIVALADMYSAMITPRNYRPPVPAKEALRELFLSRGKSVDEKLSALFIKELGVYPPGAFVELNNKERGIVIQRGKDSSPPVVSAMYGPDLKPYSMPIKRRCDQPEYQIKEAVPETLETQLNLRLVWHMD